MNLSEPKLAGHFQLTSRINLPSEDIAVITLKALHLAFDADKASGANNLKKLALTVDEAKRAELNKLSLSTLGMKLQVEIAAEAFGSQNQRIHENINIAPFNLPQVVAKLGQKPPVTADPEALAQVALRTDFEVQSKRVQLQKIRGRLDDNQLLGKIFVDNLQVPSIRFDLNLDQFDAEPLYGSPSSAGRAEQSYHGGGRNFGGRYIQGQ